MPPRYSQAADDDLREIYSHQRPLVRRRTSGKLRCHASPSMRLLGDFPRSAAERRDVDPPVRARAANSHVIIYEIDEEKRALILRFRHAREDWTTDPVNG